MYKQYGFIKKEFDLGKYGKVNYCQWCHPFEGKKDDLFTEERIRLLRKYIKPCDLVIDIGAHTGDTTIPYAVAVGVSGRVIAFEPNPAVYPILLENVKHNPQYSIQAFNLAVMDNDKDKVFTFHYSDKDLCNGGFLQSVAAGPGINGHSWPINVLGVTLDKVVPLNVGVHFIKLDTEGYDAKLIKSFAAHIDKYKPIIQCELYDALNLEEKAFLWDTVNYIGYNIYDFSSVGKDIDRLGVKITRDQILTMSTISGHDLICLPK